MTKQELNKVFFYVRKLVVRNDDVLFCMSPSAHLIDHCGGYELELHPRYLLWDKEISLMALIAERLALSAEFYFSSGTIIIR